MASTRLRLISATACVLLVAAAAVPASGAASPAWSAQAFPNMANLGCAKTAWHDNAIYLVRTPLCSLAAGQDVTFERYIPATGETQVLAHLGPNAVQGAVKAIDGKLYIFTPQHPGIEPEPVQVFDPEDACQCLIELASYFIGCAVDAASWVVGTVITWASNCVWACNFVQYDAATDAFTMLPVSLPDDEHVSMKTMGAIWDGQQAHILTRDGDLQETRFYDYDPATGTLAPGQLQDPGSGAGGLLQSGPTTGVMPIYAGPGIVLKQYDAVTGTWATLGTGVPAGLGLWDGTRGWAFMFHTGGVSCYAMAGCDIPLPSTILPAEEETGAEDGAEQTAQVVTDGDQDGFADYDGPAFVPGNTDADYDGLEDVGDNCPSVPNAGQADLDRDGLGDDCDRDADGDERLEAVGDNCPRHRNADQADADADGVGDACEATAFAPVRVAAKPADSDGDLVADRVDNCPAIANADQRDADHDLTGDACDVDRDGDGVIQTAGTPWAYLDNCPDKANADQADADGDGSGDACGHALAAGPADVVAAEDAARPDLERAGTGIPVAALIGVVAFAAAGAVLAVVLLLARRR